MYYTLTIDGKKIHSAENYVHWNYKDVTVFAGDDFHSAADASYKNLAWENLPDILSHVYTPAIVSNDKVFSP